VKHDGWRAQLHKTGDAVTIYTRRGNDVTQRFRSVAEAVARLPARSIIIDAEIIACDANGAPDFYALTRRAPHGCCAYCFDLLELDGTAYDMMGLVERRSPLRRLLKRGDGDMLRLSEVFDDPQALLAACEKRGLEGIVLKLRDERYRSGKNPGWVKVNTAAWRAANRDRWELFQKVPVDPSPTQPRRPLRRSAFGEDDTGKTAMAMLHRFTLKRNKTEGGWELKDQTGDLVATFGTKTEALKGGKLEKLLGKSGGTVRIHRQDGQFAEERTYPRSRDPRSSPG
jgi:hypothetical protein